MKLNMEEQLVVFWFSNLPHLDMSICTLLRKEKNGNAFRNIYDSVILSMNYLKFTESIINISLGDFLCLLSLTLYCFNLELWMTCLDNAGHKFSFILSED